MTKLPKEGDMYIDRDCIYPDGQVTVDEVDQLFVYFAPKGAGFREALTHDVFNILYRPLEPSDVAVVRAAWFGIDVPPFWKGWTYGIRWGGGVNPYFELPEAKAIMDNYNNAGWSTSRILFEEEKDTFIEQDFANCTTDVYKGFDLQTPEGLKHVYPIGTGIWGWEDWRPDNDEDMRKVNEWLRQNGK